MERGCSEAGNRKVICVTTSEASLDYVPPVQQMVFGRSRCTASQAIVHTTRLPRQSSIMISTDIRRALQNRSAWASGTRRNRLDFDQQRRIDQRFDDDRRRAGTCISPKCLARAAPAAATSSERTR